MFKNLTHTKSIILLFTLMMGWCLVVSMASAQDWETARQTDWETNFEDVHFLDTQNGWAVGDSGVIAHTTNGGATWTAQSSGTQNDLFAVHFVSASVGWVTGDNGTILETRNGGSSWIPQLSGVGFPLFDVYFINDSIGWAVGGASFFYDTVLLRTTNGGQNWTRFDTSFFVPDLGIFGGLGPMFGVHFIDQLTGLAVGGIPGINGIIYVTIDGGLNWGILITFGLNNLQ